MAALPTTIEVVRRPPSLGAVFTTILYVLVSFVLLVAIPFLLVFVVLVGAAS